MNKTVGLFLCTWCGLTPTNGTSYDQFSYLVIGQIMPVIASCGFFFNILVVFLFTRRQMRSSASTYLAGLGLSDMCLSATAIFVFSFLKLKRDYEWIENAYNSVVREIFTLAMVVQFTSVYITIAAAIDCFVTICVKGLRKLYCRVRVASTILGSILVLSLAYNAVHYLEMTVKECYDPFMGINKTTVCATSLRQNPTYIYYYYTLGYTVVMTASPVFILSILNILIYLKLRKRKLGGSASSRKSREEATMLMMVVLVFISCNVPALVINMLETFWSEIARNPLMSYVVDMSNLLVVINSSINFFIYVSFGSEFRGSLLGYVRLRKAGVETPNGLVSRNDHDMMVLLPLTRSTRV